MLPTCQHDGHDDLRVRPIDIVSRSLCSRETEKEKIFALADSSQDGGVAAPLLPDGLPGWPMAATTNWLTRRCFHDEPAPSQNGPPAT